VSCLYSCYWLSVHFHYFYIWIFVSVYCLINFLFLSVQLLRKLFKASHGSNTSGHATARGRPPSRYNQLWALNPTPFVVNGWPQKGDNAVIKFWNRKLKGRTQWGIAGGAWTNPPWLRRDRHRGYVWTRLRTEKKWKHKNFEVKEVKKSRRIVPPTLSCSMCVRCDNGEAERRSMITENLAG